MNISKSTVYDILSFIKDYLFSNKYVAINKSVNVAQYQIEQLFDISQTVLDNYEYEDVVFDPFFNPYLLSKHWEEFNKIFQGTVDEKLKVEYKNLIKDTLEFLEIIKSLSKVKKTALDKTLQLFDAKDEQLKMNKIILERSKVKKEIDIQRRKTIPDTEKIQELEDRYVQLTSAYNKIKENLSKVESDIYIKQNISNKIAESFEELRENAKVLEDEKNKIKCEYWISVLSIPILVIIFFILYFFFLSDYIDNRHLFISWVSFLPYTSMIPIFVALIWLCVYLKDRSNKISIELSARLFNIHYLESLMKMTNTVASSHQESLHKLDKATDTLMDSYLSQTKYNHITEKDISKMEFKELKSNPYWKLLLKMENIIKLIKQ